MSRKNEVVMLEKYGIKKRLEKMERELKLLTEKVAKEIAHIEELEKER